MFRARGAGLLVLASLSLAATPCLAVERIAEASLFVPAACDTQWYNDVPTDNPYCPWIQQLTSDGIAGTCSTGNFCPDAPVTRQEIAMLIERAIRGSSAWSPGVSVTCNWNGTKWISNGWDGPCATQTGMVVTCNNGVVTSMNWEQTGACPPLR